MEGIYSKLHDKYIKLKSSKDAEIDSINLDQEVKFMEYKSAADELIEHLRNENFRLHSQIIDLRSEIASIRSSRADHHGEPTENQNEATERFQDVQNEGLHHTAGKDDTENSQSVMSGSMGVESDTIDILNSSSKRKRRKGSTQVEPEAVGISRSNSTRKRCKHHGNAEEVTITQKASGHAPVGDLTSEEFRQIVPFGDGADINQPACCRWMQDLSGSSDAGSATKCVFQDLIERLLGMKLSASIQADRTCISALHQSSGYSFRLTLVEEASGGEVELVYNPISLGTFEKGAPEWMKEVIIFSMFMSPVFFERVLRVVK